MMSKKNRKSRRALPGHHQKLHEQWAHAEAARQQKRLAQGGAPAASPQHPHPRRGPRRPR
jgi:hypothetical protein